MDKNRANKFAAYLKQETAVEIMTAIQTEETEVSAKDAKQIACNHATHEINCREDSPWKSMVALANTAKPKKSEININPDLVHQRIIGSQSFLRSLLEIYDYLDSNKWPSVSKGALKNPTSLADRGKKIADIVVEFWKAVEGQLPEVFESPENYIFHGSLSA